MEHIRIRPMMGFGESVQTVLSKLTDFNGRARRSELWWYFMLYAIASLATKQFLPADQMLESVISIILMLTAASVTVRRLHDRGHGGWWVAASILLSIINLVYMQACGYMNVMQAVNPDPYIASKIITDPVMITLGLLSFAVNLSIFVFCVLDGKLEDNKYGASPKYIVSDKYTEN